jgi:hypothetical protein
VSRRLHPLLGLICALTGLVAHAGTPDPHLRLPEFNGLADKASDSVVISLDSGTLGMAAKFLDGHDAGDAATLDVLKGLQGIYVRSYTFEKDGGYSEADIDAVRGQLSGPGWSRLVQTRSRKSHANVDIYLMLSGGKAVGLGLIASEPRQFTIVNIVGAIDLDKLHKLEGQFGIPVLQPEPVKPSTDP